MNILLCCASGMSTSLFVAQMKKVAPNDYNIRAVAVDAVHHYLAEVDVILLGWPMRYQQADIEKMCADYNVPLALITMDYYGKPAGEALVQLAISVAQRKKLV